MIARAYAVRPAIPDNEAYTALVTLQRLGVTCAAVARATVHVFEVDEAQAPVLDALVPTIATIYNPNKHRLVPLSSPLPAVGEVWITSLEAPAPRDRVTIGGVFLPGVRVSWQATSWRLLDAAGQDVAPGQLQRAVESLLCNPAFQRAVL